MDVREVSVEYSRTVNLGDYESERVQVGLRATVEEGEASATRAAHDLCLQAREIVAAQLRALGEEHRNARIRQVRVAAPPEETP